MRVSGAFTALAFLFASSVTARPAETLHKRSAWSAQCEACFVNCASQCIEGFHLGTQVEISDMTTLNMCGMECTFSGDCKEIKVNGHKRKEAGLITDWMKQRGLITGVGQDSPGHSRQ